MMDAHRSIRSPLPVQLAEFDEPRQPALPLLLVALAIVSAAGLGWFFGGRLAREPAAPAAPAERIAALGPVRIDVDGGWTPVRARGAIAAMGLPHLAAFAPVDGLPGRAWTALAPADGPTLVPAAVRARLSAPLGRPAPTSIAGRAAWSYGTLGLRDGGHLELAVVPTAAGMLVVGCEAHASWWSTVAGCTRTLNAIGGAATVAPNRGLGFVAHVRPVLRRLNATRASAGYRLGHARHRAGQRAAALRLAAAHDAAAATLAPTAAATGRAHWAIVRLRATAGAYAALAGAARWGSRPRYAAARHRVARTERALRAALSRAS